MVITGSTSSTRSRLVNHECQLDVPWPLLDDTITTTNVKQICTGRIHFVDTIAMVLLFVQSEVTTKTGSDRKPLNQDCRTAQDFFRLAAYFVYRFIPYLHKSLEAVKKSLPHSTSKDMCENTAAKIQQGSSNLFNLAEEFPSMKRHNPRQKEAWDRGTPSERVGATVPSESIIELLLAWEAESHGFETVGEYGPAARTTRLPR